MVPITPVDRIEANEKYRVNTKVKYLILSSSFHFLLSKFSCGEIETNILFLYFRESVLTVIDILNKFIVFSKSIESTVAILIEFGTCYIVTANKTVYHLDEKDLQSKLNLLFNKNLYDIAVRIAKSNRHDSESLAEIFQRYGDYLYTKGDFMGAVEQYIKTIGYLEPSYIIRRFLDSRHINCLTDYLQVSLH